MLNDLFATTLDIFSIIWLIFSRGGWVVFVLLVVYLLYQLYLDEIQTQYKKSIEWDFLEIRMPRENATSFYSMEQIFIQLHTLFDNFNFQERLIEGRTVFSVSMEIVSLGGKISYILRVPRKHRELVESSFYASYPEMEITDVEDYLANYEFDPDDDNVSLFGADMILIKDQIYPIRTYKEFEGLTGPEASQLVVDPLAPLLEVLTKISPSEFVGYQMIIQPVLDGSWQDAVEKEIENLKGETEYVQLDEVTKDQITSLKRKLTRPGFNTKIRVLHLGKAEGFHKDYKKLLLSPFRIYGSAVYNSFKPAFSTKKDWMISPTLEQPYIKHWQRRRMVEIFKGYKDRSTWIGSAQYVLNSEELATIFHFPATVAVTKTPAPAIEMKKVAPPINLPIEE